MRADQERAARIGIATVTLPTPSMCGSRPGLLHTAHEPAPRLDVGRRQRDPIDPGLDLPDACESSQIGEQTLAIDLSCMGP